MPPSWRRVRAERRADDMSAENDRLRDALQGLERENARLEGYVDRVQEFDPVPERQAPEHETPAWRPTVTRWPEGMDTEGRHPGWWRRQG